MNRYTRGEFLGIGAALATGFGVGDFELRGADARHARARAKAIGQEAGDVTPDLVVVGGRVYTVDDDLPRAEAFAVKNSRFVAVGSSDDIRNLAGPGTEVIDAGGMTITPGFIDAHLHPASGGVRELTEVNLDVRSMAEIGERLREGAAGKPPGEWVLAFKYDDTKVREGRRITRRNLDEWVPDHPVRVSHRGGHLYWYNSRAFELAGITAATESPPGGHIYLDYDIPVAGASDYVPGPYEPMMALQSMVTRTDSEGRVWGPNQRVSVSEALRIATINGARASHEERLKGSITPGKLADFVILAEDPHETDPEALQEIGIVRTVVGGRTMHLG